VWAGRAARRPFAGDTRDAPKAFGDEKKARGCGPSPTVETATGC
jgi:hypothetical protein